MALDREPSPGRPVTWVGEASGLVRPGETGTFCDFDGGPDSYVVDFGPGRVFCCKAKEVQVHPLQPSAVKRRHNSTP